MHISQFLDSEILFDPTLHSYSAQQRILSTQNANDFITRNRLNRHELPCVFANEPCAKYLGARPGDIIEYHVESFVPDVLLQFEVFHRLVRQPLEKIKKSKS